MGALGELAGLRANGEEFPIEAAISRSLIAGKPVFTAIVRDITERKHFEEQLRRAAEELARSNNDLQQFAYVVSHDLQEPLRTISGFLGLLDRRLHDGLDAETREYMQYIVEGGQRMQQMIADLLAYSRVGAKDVKTEIVPLREPLDRALEMLRAAIEQSAAAIRVEDLPTVRANAGQWTQVFQNLIGNAIKFRSERPLEIQVGAKRDGQFWLVWVKDNGIGIEPRVPRADIRGLPAPPHAEAISRHRHRPGDLQEGRRAPRRPHLGRVRTRARGHVLLHDSRRPCRL